MRYQRINRRHFLQGVGAGLALPFLPSLAPRTASADVFDGPKYFIAMETPHGNVPIEDWCPIDAPLNEVQLYSGSASAGLDHKMRYGSLSNLLRSRSHTYNPGGIPELTPVLGNFLNPYLDKLNLLSGLDITFNVGHHEGANLGNYHDIIDGNVRGDLELPSMPTIDRVIARSPNFYGPGDPFTVRSINLGSGMEASMDGPVGSVNALPLPGEEQQATGPNVETTAEPEPVATSLTGPQVYNVACNACHGTGVGGAPVVGDTDAWVARIAQGMDVLNDHAINGFSGEAMTPMLPKGGRPDLSDQEIYDAVAYMVDQSQ